MSDQPSGEQDAPTGPKITCLCLQTFVEGERDYVHLTPPQTVDAEGRTAQTSMVCCNDCWLKMGMFQRSMLSVLTTPAEFGGLALGSLLHERFWPDILRTFTNKGEPPPDDDEFEMIGPESPPVGHVPPGSEVSRMIDDRQRRRTEGDIE